MNMLTAEYDYEMDMRVNREAAMNIGRQQGRKEGLLEGRQEGDKPLFIDCTAIIQL